MHPEFIQRGFLPARDPVQSFAPGSELSMLDALGRDLPSLLEDPGFRTYVRGLRLPDWPDARSGAGREDGSEQRAALRAAAAFAQGCGGPTKLNERSRGIPALNEDQLREETLPELRLYYVRLGFLASAYINQVTQPGATVLPRNIAIPLCKACALLGRPPILSYDGYALYNWKRVDPNGPIALGNIETLQNFVHLYDEHWFILVHVEIEAIAADIFGAINRAARALDDRSAEEVSRALRDIASAVWRQVAVIRRIPEKMDPTLYYRTFRPYIRFFENVVYEGVNEAPMDFRGETGAQSSIMPSLVAFMKIRHGQSALTDHLADMRRFMPPPHRQLIAELEAMPSVREIAHPHAYNEVLEAMATFREVHYGWAQEYINRWVDDPRGTGGTPYMPWLRQLIEETRFHKLPG